MEQRVLVCGGRNYSNEAMAFEVLDTAHAANPIVEVIHGDAPGADMIAHRWGLMRGIEVKPFPADWDRYGRAAGPIRNRQMLDEGKPHLVIAFPGGRGTRNMIEQAEGANVPVVIVKK